MGQIWHACDDGARITRLVPCSSNRYHVHKQAPASDWPTSHSSISSTRRGALPHVCLVLGSTHERTATTPNRREVCLETARDECTRVEGGGEVLDMKLANQTYVRC
jgi:hypothetical protein